MQIKFKFDDSNFVSNLEKAIYQKSKEAIINKIKNNLSQSELDKVTIVVIGNIMKKFSLKIDGDKNVVNKIQNIFSQHN